MSKDQTQDSRTPAPRTPADIENARIAAEGTRDALCATQHRHRSQCDCTGAKRGPIQAATKLR
jgi:hypothetical protein